MTVKIVIVQYEPVFEVCRTWEDGSCTVRLHKRSAVRVMTKPEFMMDDPLLQIQFGHRTYRTCTYAFTDDSVQADNKESIPSPLLR